MSNKKRKKSGKKSKANKAFDRRQKKLQTIKTPNGKLIYQLIMAKGVRDDYKDYVIITPTEIIDWQEKWVVVSGDAFSKPQLVHKKLLKHVLGEDVAAKIWHPKFGRAVAVKPATKKSEVKK